jgi:hypothetical protein
LSQSSRIIVGVLGVVYLAFLLWYGGSGDPLTPVEREAYLARLADLAEQRGEENPEIRDAFEALFSQDDGNEYFMINLMKFREEALYPEGYDYDDDVEAAAARYSAGVVPALIKRGSIPILVADIEGRFIDFEGADEWDQVGIVRYRSRRDMIEMALELGERDLGIHKWASIEKTHVFPAEPMIDFVFVRGAVAALFMVIGAILVLLIRLIAGRGRNAG